MIKKFFIFSILFFEIISFFPLTRSDAQETIPVLNMEQVVEMALRGNQDLIAARYQVEEARGRLKQASLFPNPELESDFGFDAIFANEGERNFSAAISQPLSLTGRIGAQKKVAKVDIKLSLADIANLERLLVKDVRQVFIEILAIDEQQKLQETLIKLNSELINGIKSGIKEGLASEQDLNAVKIALHQAKQEKEVLIALRKSRQLELNRLMGKPPTYIFDLQGIIDYESDKDLDNYNVEMAFSKRPDLRFEEYNIELARAALRLAKALRFKDITTGIFYENDRLVFDIPGSKVTDKDQLIGFKLTIPIPIFDRKQGLIAEARARERRAEESVGALKLAISQEVSDALNRATTLSALLDTYQSGILKKAEENVKLVEDGFKQGLVGIVDVIQSRQQFATLTSSYINTVRNYQISLNDLQIATGNYPSTIDINKPKEDKNK